MPVMNGWELIKTIKPFYPFLKIVILSGWTKNIPEERQSFVMKNVDSILEKPITIEKLKNVLQMINR